MSFDIKKNTSSAEIARISQDQPKNVRRWQTKEIIIVSPVMERVAASDTAKFTCGLVDASVCSIFMLDCTDDSLLLVSVTGDVVV